ncbi:MAG: hypothetical protein AB7U79_04710 [Candidatus Izemoplasmatales bacterium]
MNTFRLVKYDHTTSDQASKDIISNFLNLHISKLEISKEDAYEQFMLEIVAYQMRVYVAYDGGYPFGIVVCSNLTLYYHQLVHFVYVEEKYRTVPVYHTLFDLLLQNKDFKGLCMISNKPITEDYLNAGFVKVDYKNPDKLLIYFRSIPELNESNKQEYLKKQMNYLKKYKLLFNLSIYSIVFLIFSLFITLLVVLNESASVVSKILLPLISIGLLIASFVSRYYLKEFNELGKRSFGFIYDLGYISRYQYKFNQVSKDFLSSIFLVIMDSGV